MSTSSLLGDLKTSTDVKSFSLYTVLYVLLIDRGFLFSHNHCVNITPNKINENSLKSSNSQSVLIFPRFLSSVFLFRIQARSSLCTSCFILKSLLFYNSFYSSPSSSFQILWHRLGDVQILVLLECPTPEI